MQRQIMIVGENLKFCKHLKYELQDEMLQCYYALNSTDGLRHLRHYPCRLVLYETAKISTDVLHQVGQIRAARPDVLIVVLCPDMGPQDYADVLTTADNFISHICDGQTCKSILEAVLRRSARTDPSAKNLLISEDGNVLIDPARRSVEVSSKTILLQRLPFNLLYFLAINEGIVFSRNQILEDVWGNDFDGDEHTLSNQVSKLREKLKLAPHSHNYIKTIHGVGYSFSSK